MPRTVVITSDVRDRLSRYIYNITINPSINPKDKVDSLQRALDKANAILSDLYKKLSIDCVTFKQTRFEILGKKYGYREYQYKDKSSKTTWLFGCDTTPAFNFVMVMENSRLCVSQIERYGNLLTERRRTNRCKKRRIRLAMSDLRNISRRVLAEKAALFYRLC